VLSRLLKRLGQLYSPLTTSLKGTEGHTLGVGGYRQTGQQGAVADAGRIHAAHTEQVVTGEWIPRGAVQLNRPFTVTIVVPAGGA